MLTGSSLLLCVDLQNEILAQQTPCLVAEAETIVERCIAMQSEWRNKMWPVAHLKRTASATHFISGSHLADWIEQVRPLPSDLVFEHSLPSAYSSAKFCEYMSYIGSIRCVVVGFSLHDTIISTVIEGYHRGDKYEVIGPAVGCIRDRKNALKYPILEILRSFSKVIGSAAIGESR